MEYLAIHGDSLLLVVNNNLTGTRYAALTHTTGNHGSVRCHTAAHCEDTLGNCHTAEVFGRCLDADKDNFFLVLSPCLGIVGLEYNLTGSGTRRRGKTLGDNLGRLERALVEDGVEKLVEFLRLHAEEGSLLVDHAVAEKIHCDADHSGAGTLTVTGLEHPELAVLDSELHILHVAEVVLKLVGSGNELCCEVRH